MRLPALLLLFAGYAHAQTTTNVNFSDLLIVSGQWTTLSGGEFSTDGYNTTGGVFKDNPYTQQGWRRGRFQLSAGRGSCGTYTTLISYRAYASTV